MGAVYKARQTKLNRLVAVKVLPRDSAHDSNFAERFAREAQALARLNHPNIVAVHDFGEVKGQYCFIMEYVDGLDLRQLLQKGPTPPDEALAIVRQLCDALQYAHEEGVVHRDIKPANILIDRKGRVKIADFGLAKLLGRDTVSHQLTGSHQVMGTLQYMAPEQMEAPQKVDHRADLYALGVVLYEMLTGELPHGRFALPSEKSAGDTRLDQIVVRAMEKNPDQRYQSASEIQRDVAALMSAAPTTLAVPLASRSFDRELDQEMLRYQLTGPAMGLILTAVLALIQWLAVAIWGFFEIRGNLYQWSAPWWYAIFLQILGLLFVPPAVWVLVRGARKMLRLDKYTFCLGAAIWAMIPWAFAFVLGLPRRVRIEDIAVSTLAIMPAILAGVPAGIWALLVLRRPDVKREFARRAIEGRSRFPSPAPETIGDRGKLRSFIRAVRSLVFWTRGR
jgi:tRNA A-37 threonylcarbamoyl transferase component Bud32